MLLLINASIAEALERGVLCVAQKEEEMGPLTAIKIAFFAGFVLKFMTVPEFQLCTMPEKNLIANSCQSAPHSIKYSSNGPD